MTDEELKKKIEDILEEYNFETDDGEGWVLSTDEMADALIAAGIGDVSSEKAMRELAEAFHREKCAEYDLLNYQMQKSEYRIAEAEHRAEKAERALKDCIDYYSYSGLCPVMDCNYNKACWRKECTPDIEKCFMVQAEKELAEEKR